MTIADEPSTGGMGDGAGADAAPAPAPDDVIDAELLNDQVVEAELLDDELPDGPDDAPLAEEATEVVEADPLEVAEAERDEYLDSLRRLQAEFENYKKRVLKQQTEQMTRAAASLVDKLLPVLEIGRAHV